MAGRPTIRLPRGAEARVQSGTPSPLQIEATIAVNEEGNKALYDGRLLWHDDVVHSQTFAVQLAGGGVADEQ